MLDKVAIIGTIAVGVAIGLFWPSSNASHLSRDPSAPAEVVLERSSDHHYYADADVNGRPIHFMIDTGASETALSEADAQALGIKLDPAKFEVIGNGASGMVRGQYVQLGSIELNGIKQKDARAVVVAGADVSLLGQPFLENIDQIVISKGEMRLISSTRS